MPDGSTGRLSCNLANAVGANGTAIEQNLHCTGGSVRFDITSNAAARGAWLSGIWAEADHGVKGNLSGRVGRSGILAHIAGNGFAARMLVRKQGDREFVTMRSFTLRPQRGAGTARLSVALHK